MTEDLRFYCYDHLKKFLKHTLILHRRDSDKEEQYSYGAVTNEAMKLQLSMQNSGVRDSYGVALHFKEHTPALCVGLISILNCGCYFSPLEQYGTLASNAKHLVDLVQKFGSRFLLADTLLSLDLPTFRKLFQCTIFEVELFFYQITTDITEVFPNNICYSIGTSGTTGQSKVVYVPYSCIASNVDSLSDLLGISHQDVVMLFAPISFDPFVVELFFALRNGAALIITSEAIRKNPKKLCGIMFPKTPALRGATILQMTPSLFRLLVTSSMKNVEAIFDETNSLRILLLGGEEFPSVEEWNSWLPKKSSSRNCGKRVFNVYGLTEISCWSTIYEWVSNERTPLGKPIDNETKLRLIDSKGNEIYQEGTGELQIGSASRKCFLTLDEAKCFNECALQYRSTGDIVERDINSSLFFVGRLNNVFKRFGKQVCADQVETNIKNILSELHANVACTFEESRKELIAFIELNEKRSTAQEQKTRMLINNKLDKHQRPDKIIFVNRIPLTLHGKKCWRELTDHFNSVASPVIKFQEFIEGTLGIKYSNIQAEKHPPSSKVKHLKSNWHVSFTAAGGTSFHALSLATGIGMHFANPEDNKEFLSLLLDENVLLVDISGFLSNAKLKNSIITNHRVDDTTALELKFLWQTDLRKCVDATASYCNQYNCICVGSHARAVFTLNASTGAEIAVTEFPDRIEGQVTFISSSLALVGCYDGHLYAFDFLEGKVIWHINLGGMVKSKPLLFNDCAIVSSYAAEANLKCISLKSRTIVWQESFGIKGILATPLLLKSNKLLVCSLDGTYASVCAKCGQVSWRKKLSSPIFSKPVAISDATQVIIAEVSGTVNICSVADGRKICHYLANGHIFSGICIKHIDMHNIFILFGCHDHHFYCLKYNCNELNVEVHWKYCLASPVYSTAKILKENLENSYGLVCTCSTKGMFVVLSIKTGLLLANFNLDGEVFSSPCTSDDESQLYIGCRNNFLYCLSLNSLS